MHSQDKQRANLNFEVPGELRSSPTLLSVVPSPGFEPGKMIADRFVILELLGRGAAGSVYRVLQVFLKKQFALKVLNGLVLSSNTVRRFQIEAQAASRLEHPNLAKAVDFGLIDDHQPFIVMEFVKGSTLADYLKQNGRLTLPEVLKVFIPIFNGMAHAHAQGVIHRDIKPSNIILMPVDESSFMPKVVDFGIAKVVLDQDTEGLPLTRTGEVFGTPLYMSPEQCSGIRVDCRSDIYSLGCVIFEALTGAPPFFGETALQMMMQHCNETPPSLKEASLGLDFPPAMETVMSQLLAKEPGDRYQNCIDGAADLAAILGNKRLAQNRQTSVANTSSRSEKSKADNRHNRLLYSLPFLLMLIATAAYFLGRQRVLTETLPDNSDTLTATNLKQNQTLQSDSGKIFEELAKTSAKDSLRQYLTSVTEAFNFSGPGNQIEEEDLSLLKSRPRIIQVTLNNQKKLGDGAIKYLSSNLKSLSMMTTGLSNIGLKEISARIPMLESLDIRNDSKITDIECLTNLKMLSTLKISGIRHPHKSWKTHGPYLRELRDLDAAYGIFDDGALDYVTTLPSIRHLAIFGSPHISDFGAKKLACCKTLNDLDLHDLKIGDATLAALQHLTLVKMNLSKTQVTKMGVTKLLQKMLSLRHLELAMCPNLTRADLIALQQQFERCTIVP
jgi:serine/threonine protein kinase